MVIHWLHVIDFYLVFMSTAITRFQKVENFFHEKPSNFDSLPAATVETLIQAMLSLMNKPDHEVRVIGTRHGEKLFEALLSREERACAQDLPGYFRVPADARDLNYDKFVEQGETKITHAEEYTSHNTTRLDVEGMKTLLLKLDFMKRIARGEHAVADE